MRGLTLCIALNYGSRAEIVDAARSIANDVRDGRLDPASIDEELIDARLSTAGLPDPDLLLRTAGEMRISNFLLWQISYAELVVTDVAWPDFSVDDLHAAFEASPAGPDGSVRSTRHPAARHQFRAVRPDSRSPAPERPNRSSDVDLPGRGSKP